MVFFIVPIDIKKIKLFIETSEKVIYCVTVWEKYQPYTKKYIKTLDKAANYMAKNLTPSGCQSVK